MNRNPSQKPYFILQCSLVSFAFHNKEIVRHNNVKNAIYLHLLCCAGREKGFLMLKSWRCMIMSPASYVAATSLTTECLSSTLPSIAVRNKQSLWARLVLTTTTIPRKLSSWRTPFITPPRPRTLSVSKEATRWMQVCDYLIARDRHFSLVSHQCTVFRLAFPRDLLLGIERPNWPFALDILELEWAGYNPNFWL